MADFCVNCGRKLGGFDKRIFGKLCRECAIALNIKQRAEVAEVENKRTKGYCKECGKELHSTLSFRNLCSDCITEENKRKWRHCKECGKELPIVPPLNSDQSGYLRNLCSDCELMYPGKFNTRFNARYTGGYAAFPEPKDVKLQTYPDHLEVPELGLTISYNQLRNVQSMTKESLSAGRMFLVGLYAFAWKKNKVYLVITFNDAIGIEQNPVFDVDHISAIQPFLYQQMVNARMG